MALKTVVRFDSYTGREWFEKDGVMGVPNVYWELHYRVPIGPGEVGVNTRWSHWYEMLGEGVNGGRDLVASYIVEGRPTPLGPRPVEFGANDAELLRRLEEARRRAPKRILRAVRVIRDFRAPVRRYRDGQRLDTSWWYEAHGMGPVTPQYMMILDLESGVENWYNVAGHIVLNQATKAEASRKKRSAAMKRSWNAREREGKKRGERGSVGSVESVELVELVGENEGEDDEEGEGKGDEN